MNAVKKYLSEIGAKGGKAGTGESKSRGDSEYYRAIALRRKKKGKRNHVASNRKIS